MASSILETKLQIPPQSHLVVDRPRLINSLERALPFHKLIAIAAPAGYGKTTLLAQWARSRRRSVAWLSLDVDDNDLERFIRYLVAAWQKIQPDILEGPLGILLSARSPEDEALTSAFINAAGHIPGHTTFVLDDFHLIEDPSIHRFLISLLDHLPPSLHFVLAGRGEPSLPLARYRAHDQLMEYGVEDLSFRPAEAREFLNATMGLDLAQDEVVRLQGQLEGWIAGLQLVALAIRRGLTGPDRLVISGRHRFIADFLAEDVFAPLSGSLQHFMLQISLLDRLSGPLCDAVTGRADSQDMLETVEREGLFLMPLDDSRQWFRYHPLFAGFLRAELERRHPTEVAGLHRRAAQWYLEQDLPERAFRHAVSGADIDILLQILERYLVVKLLSGEIKVLAQWLDSLPEEWLWADPTILLARAGVSLATGQYDASARLLDRAERLAQAHPEDARWHQARVTAMRCNIACFQNDLPRAEALAAQALQGLPPEDLSFRPGVYGALGDTYRRHGRWQEAKDCYLELLDFTDAPSFSVEAVHVFGALADLELRQGHLRRAVGYWREALEAIQKRENWGKYPLPLTGWVHIRLGELLYEWNKLAEAWDHLEEGLERAELGGDVRAMIAGYLAAGRLKLTSDDTEGAAANLERARGLVERAQFAHWTSRFERFQLELWLTQGSVGTAVDWTNAKLRDAAFQNRPERETAQLAMARVLIEAGDMPSIERARALLEELLPVSEEEGRMGVTIEAQSLQALAQWRRGEHVDAMASLERALRLAEPEGYVRRIADLGWPMARLLQEARSRNVMPDYIERLLSAYSPDSTLTTSAKPPMPEPLTPREREILQLLAAGLTNREIAEQLVISPGTVKKHAGNLYGKLGVHGRIQAAIRARELGLLD